MTDELQPTGEVHPVADLFPMLDDDELADLAADIQANGLQQPLVLDADGILIDGRNRLAACRIAGVKPRFVSLNGRDAQTYILESNHRRDMTKGQKAIVAAQTRVFDSNMSQASAGRALGVAQSVVAKAEAILEYTPEIIPAIMDRSRPFDAAYTEAVRLKAAKEERTRRVDATRQALARLRKLDPQLAELVKVNGLTLEEARKILDDRQTEARRVAEVTTRTFVEALLTIAPVPWEAEAIAADRVQKLDPGTQSPPADLSPARIRRCAAVLEAIAKQLEEGRHG